MADPDKLAVGGWSYGGISTDFIIAQTTRFKAAISGAGSAFFAALYGHDEYVLDYDMELGAAVGRTARVGQNLALLQGRKHYHANTVHGRRHRLECADRRRRADVRGA